jgi:hypothetical protein
MTTLTMKGKRFVLVPEKEYEKMIKELSILDKENIVLAKEISQTDDEEYIDVEAFKQHLKQRIKTLRRKKK